MLALVLVLVALDVCTCPVSCTSWQTGHVVQKSPERVVTLNQGTLEILLALGFHIVMFGTAYIDDYIWPQYATEYASIPALGGPSYPNESVTMSVKPDFVVASYKCASHETYVDSRGRTRGIFSNDTIYPCIGKASEWEGARNTCRPQVHAAGIGTYFFADACEDTSLTPPKVAEAAAYQEMRSLGNIFNVDVEPLMTNMIDEFNDAVAMVSSAMVGTQMRAVWLDCVGRRCKSEVPDYVFIGAGDGASRMLMREAGLKTISAGEDRNMACALESQVIAANLDVLIVEDAVWDRGINPMTWVHRQSERCEMGVLKGARFIQIPFRATTLGPRNGTATVDIAVASLHVRVGSLMVARKSGVGSFNPSFIENYVEGLACSAEEDCIVYTDAAPSSTPGPTPSPTPAPTPSPKPAPTLASTPSPTPAPTPTPIATAEHDVLSGHPPIQSAHWPWALALVLAWSSLF